MEREWPAGRAHGVTLGNQNAKKQMENGVDNVNSVSVPKGGTKRAYLLARLKRDEPILFERVVNGELSAHQAAILAGFVKQETGLSRLNKAWEKATEEEREAQGLGEVYHASDVLETNADHSITTQY